MRYVRLGVLFLIVLCLVDASQECAISASFNLPDDDDRHHFAAVFYVAVLLDGSPRSIQSSIECLALLCFLQSNYHPLRQ
jgi:hypothetical protein